MVLLFHLYILLLLLMNFDPFIQKKKKKKKRKEKKGGSQFIFDEGEAKEVGETELALPVSQKRR